MCKKKCFADLKHLLTAPSTLDLRVVDQKSTQWQNPGNPWIPPKVEENSGELVESDFRIAPLQIYFEHCLPIDF